jgi:transposase
LVYLPKTKNHSKKKITFYKERDEQKRQEFLKTIESVSKSQLVYIDESGIEQFLCRPYARSFRGNKVYGSVSGKRFARESFIAAKVDHKIFAPLCYQGTCNTALFNMWIEKMLVPELRTGQIVIMDNATFHKSAKTRELIEEKGCRLVFLPPYSPDLNPIEKFWANFKRRIRTIVNHFETLSQAIDYAFLCVI